MLQSLVIALREGLEAFLIVGITLAYLRQTGRAALVSATHWGIGVSVLTCFAAGWALGKAESQPLWEGSLALVAAVLVISMVIYMLKAARFLKQRIHARLEASAVKTGAAAWFGVFAFVVLMITREGMETALMLSSLAALGGAGDMITGALLGIALAGTIAWAGARFGARLDLARFFQVTSVFLLLFAVQLVFYAFHEFTETGLLPIDNEYWHLATEPYAPEGEYGSLITSLLLFIPLAWYVMISFRDRLKPAVA
ncbi:MAG: FTR1 family protein [Rhodocyclaceae bacterium]|nr:FTR1 family protein [Rhodocyclaceae bacterium]